MGTTPEDTISGLFSVKGKTFLVTGGTRGIGFVLTRGLLMAGARVIITSRKQQACDEAERQLSAFGEVTAIPADLGSEDECRRLVREVEERTERLDVLVNNAGATWGARLEEYPDAGWDRVMNLNVKGVFNVTRFSRHLLERAAAAGTPARVINISSVDGMMVPFFDNYAYSASKAALNHLTRHLAADLSPKILVNAIAPGPFPSKMMEATLAERGDEFLAMSSVGRLGVPDDIVGAVMFLSSRASEYITGAVLPLDGGLSTLGPARHPAVGRGEA